MTVLLLGGSGILGSAFRGVLPGALPGREVLRVRSRWGDPGAAAAALASELAPRLTAGPVTLVWAAGAGAVGASPDAMRRETADVAAVCELVGRLPPGFAGRLDVLFASSAGALFAGHGTALVDDASPPAPLSAYGHEKLAQEGLLRDLAAAGSARRVLLARYTNLYGLADGRLTPRGLVSTAVRATRLRQPMTIFVSPDTRRDLVFARDAALLGLDLLSRAPGGCTTALVRDGTTRTVGEILGVVGHVCGRQVPAVYAERPETRLQPLVLRFAAPARGPGALRRTSLEVAVHRLAHAPLARL